MYYLRTQQIVNKMKTVFKPIICIIVFTLALKKVALAKGNYEAAQYDNKTKEILSQPKLLELYKAETARIRATNGTSEYGSNNVFGSTSGVFLNRN